MLINLVGNAVKYTETDRICLRVGIEKKVDNSDRSEQDYLKLEVEDTGPGIPAEELDRLFVPFEQASAGRKLKQGTGLGLSITNKFVQLMEREISVSSTVGVGTCFQVSIPIALGEGEACVERLSRGRVVGLAPDRPSYRILVVDDEPDSCQVLLDLLGPVGFSVRLASNGQEAIDIWRDWRPHLIWMDLRMPEMDGYEATQWIREREAEERGNADSPETSSSNSLTKIVALSASVFKGKRDLMMAAGFDGYLIKPFQEENIWEAMRQYLGVEFTYRPTSEGNAIGLARGDRPRINPLGRVLERFKDYVRLVVNRASRSSLPALGAQGDAAD